MSTRAVESRGEVTRLLHDFKAGSVEAGNRLMEVVHTELKRLARHYMQHERRDHTIQATALVNEAYLRLADSREIDWQGRAHFIGVAAQMMRRVLIDHARGRMAAKRGGSGQKVQLEDWDGPALGDAQSGRIVAIDEALTRLAQVDERQSRIVELRFFGGLTVEETAEVVGVSPKTVKRDWNVARAWLKRELENA